MEIDEIARALEPWGMNLVGAAPAAAYDARVRADLRLAELAPWARAVIVVGNGGGALWRRVVEWSEGRGGVNAVDDPIDDFTVETIERVVPPLFDGAGIRHRIAYPFRFAEDPVSFVDLGIAAGLGSPSLLRVLVHPTFGPWIALRAAILVDRDVTAPRPAEGFDPCPTCTDRACIAACPGGVVRFPEGWDVAGCIDHRTRTGDCESRCHARFDCIVGREHRYPDDALAHHHRRAWRVMSGRG